MKTAARISLLLCLGLAFTATAQERAAIRFVTVDVFVDSHDQPLAAYQLEVAARRGNAKLAGIEGGEHAAFSRPPYYDPKAIQQERVILAAFNAAKADGLPKGRTRVATLHVQITGAEPPEFAAKLVTAGNAAGRKIGATASLEERKTK